MDMEKNGLFRQSVFLAYNMFILIYCIKEKAEIIK